MPLRLIQSCLSNVTSPTVKVSPPRYTQASLESFAVSYASVIANSNATSDLTCVAALLPFMCHALFPPCIGDGPAPRFPSRTRCEKLSIESCPEVWREARSRFPDLLPDCSMLPLDNDLDRCLGKHACSYQCCAEQKVSQIAGQCVYTLQSQI